MTINSRGVYGLDVASESKVFFYGGFGTSTPPTLQNCILRGQGGYKIRLEIAIQTPGCPLKSKKKTFDSHSRLVALKTHHSTPQL